MNLLPCPFCGGDAEIERKGSYRCSMIIACTNCGGRMESGDVVGLTDPKAWRWNVRSNPEFEKLRKISDHVPPLVFLKAKEAAGFGDEIKPRS